MSNRDSIIAHRQTLRDLDGTLASIEAAIAVAGSAKPRYLIGRTRALLRAAKQQLAAALREQLDGISERAA